MESEGSLCGFRLGSLAVCAHSGLACGVALCTSPCCSGFLL